MRCGEDIPVHHVFRDRERAASRAAFEAGLSPEPVYAEPGILVLRFIDGRTFGEADLAANLERIVPVLKKCHGAVGRHLRGPANAFWVFHVIRDYVAVLGAEPRYLAVADRLEQAQRPLPVVFGHHDLLPGNFIDDGRRLWLIDWEYGGFGSPMFDLANLSSNGNFGPAEDRTPARCLFPGRGRRGAARSVPGDEGGERVARGIVGDRFRHAPQDTGRRLQAHARDYFARFDKLVG